VTTVPPVARGATLRRLRGLARPEMKMMVVGTIFLAFGSGVALLYPQGMRLVIDAALGKVPSWAPAGTTAEQVLTYVIAGMAIASVVSAIAMGIRFYCFTLAGERAAARLRDRLFARIIEQEVAFFDTERTGDLTSRLASDTAVLQGAFASNISMALRNGVQLVGAIALLLLTSVKLALVMLCIVPVIAIGAVIYGRRVRKLARAVQDAIAAGGAVASESIVGLRTVRSFAAEPYEIDRYAEANRKALDTARRRARASGLFLFITSGAGYLAIAVVFWYGGKLVQGGNLSPGSLTSFLVYTLFIGISLGTLADLWADAMRSIGAAERVFELLDRQPAMLLSGGVVPAGVEGGLAIDGLRFAYPTRPDVPVLDNLSLHLAPGESVALVGPSGAGKSTVAALLARFYDPQAGVIRLDGRDLRDLDPAWLRRQIGTVAQEPLLFSTSILDNIRYGRPGATRQEIEAAARTANADSFIRTFPESYDTLVGERGVQLSGGQKQRVAIARAVLKDPRVLILDEATSALDAESEHLVKEALERLMRGRTTLIIAHRLSTVKDAGRVVVLDHGKVAESGTHEALVAHGGLYQRLVQRQVSGLE
jgi:ATP-binding cassette subfamily B protein